MDNQTIEETIARLEVFKDIDRHKRRRLVKPISRILSQDKRGILDLEAINQLIVELHDAWDETQSEVDTLPGMNSQYLADQIRPWVEQIRLKLFGSKSAPFGTQEDAQTWLDGVDKDIDDWHRQADEFTAKMDQQLALIQKYRDLWEALEGKYPFLKQDKETKLAQLRQGLPVTLPDPEEFAEINSLEQAWRTPVEPLKVPKRIRTWERLIKETNKIYQVTGFTKKSVEMYILADKLPVLPSFRLVFVNRSESIPTGGSVANRYALVAVRRDLSFEELRSLHRTIREKMGIKRSKRPTAKHLQLYQMVQQRGGTPGGKGKVAFWKSLRLDWNKQYRKPQYTTWKGVKIAYDRLCKKMNDDFLVKTEKGGP